jgi:hypothetical protein
LHVIESGPNNILSASATTDRQARGSVTFYARNGSTLTIQVPNCGFNFFRRRVPNCAIFTTYAFPKIGRKDSCIHFSISRTTSLPERIAVTVAPAKDRWKPALGPIVEASLPRSLAAVPPRLHYQPGGGMKSFSPPLAETFIQSLNMLTKHLSPFIFENEISAGSTYSNTARPFGASISRSAHGRCPI